MKNIGANKKWQAKKFIQNFAHNQSIITLITLAIKKSGFQKLELVTCANTNGIEDVPFEIFHFAFNFHR